ncbi:hypothetical protein RND71_003221 [Anisodus tanguticus]|uniref:DNA-directed DNA polymerase n=1 Tax=Anisodus tanguticus TaxID=243964 RepID=A0AAE1SW91_9SOLA|nr:hypothetical protein RND71_003221 [Anisodus tanguticus]
MSRASAHFSDIIQDLERKLSCLGCAAYSLWLYNREVSWNLKPDFLHKFSDPLSDLSWTSESTLRHQSQCYHKALYRLSSRVGDKQTQTADILRRVTPPLIIEEKKMKGFLQNSHRIENEWLCSSPSFQGSESQIEELKFAVKLGYTVLPMKGYLFEKGEGSPFKDFVSSLSDNRIWAKQKGNAVMSYIQLLIMNSLYGRLGISPESTVNDVVDDARRKYLLQTSVKFLYSHPLENNWHSVAYRVNTQSTVDKWTPNKNSAV